MRVGQLAGITTTKTIKEKQNKDLLNKSEYFSIDKSNKLSYLSIPSIAFAGNFVVPVMPEVQSFVKPKIGNLLERTKFEEENNFLQTSYTVYPQDPLVSKPEKQVLRGEVKPGPENNRIKVYGDSEPAVINSKGEFDPKIDTPQFDRVNAFYFANKAVNLYEKTLGRKLPWAFEDKQVKLFPRAGVMANAYYNRWGAEIKLFYYQNSFDKQETCYTSKMADIITHETGHAIIDGMRPTYATWGYYGGAIHEGFGDATAMLVALQNDKIIDKVIEQTAGDLRKENMVASLAEQFGNTLRKDRAMYLRNAINDMKMSDFDTGKAKKEVHVLGRLLDAAFYDIYVDMVSDYKKSSPLKEAMIKARDDLTRLHARAVADFMPVANVYVEDFARAYLKADKVDFDGKYSNILEKLFLKRELLNASNAKGWEQELTNLPLLKIDKSVVESNKTIEKFVNSHNKILKVPSDNHYEVETAYSNADGETFIHLKAPREIELPVKNDDNNKPYGIIVYDVMSLGFNENGELFYKSVKNTRRRGVKEAIEEATKALETLEDRQTKPEWDPGLSPVYKQSNTSNVLIKPPRF